MDDELTTKAETRELLDMSRTCLNQLREHVEDVLAYMDAPSIGRLGLTVAIDEIAGLVMKAAQQAQLSCVRITIAPDLESNRIRLAPKALELSLVELLQNARKFHPRRSPEVEVAVQRASASRVLLQVIDNGQTLPPDRLSKVWQPCYQSEKLPTGEVSGMGLGLSMVASMVREQGGSCHLNNRTDGPGITVELELGLVLDK
jgi:K+-sensing histidine kinase KdpD